MGAPGRRNKPSLPSAQARRRRAHGKPKEPIRAPLVRVTGKTERGRLARILIVDDFDDNRAMYAEYLSSSGYEVEQASDGREAVEAALRTLPDLIVMDLSLPVMDGWEATRRLKADERARHIRVIVLTGHALSGDAERAGADAFLAKPCLPETLVEKIEELMRTR
jgi:two-component system cell cycle response regulator DivK